jgi:transcription elongation factor Elf1
MTLSSIEVARAEGKLPTACPECDRLKLFVLETRASGAATRRRRACSACGYRFTTYEITADKYKLLKNKNKPKPKPSTKPLKSNCRACLHWESSRCSLDIPEAGGWFADECNFFQPSYTTALMQ